jgi:hypothetical protein
MNYSANIPYLSNAIDEIIDLIGVKRPIEESAIYQQFRAGNIQTCMECIAKHMSLPIGVCLTYIPIDGTIGEKDHGFASQSLSGTDKNGIGTGGIAAQVSIPDDLPLYGSSQFESFPIKIRVSKNCFNYPETFMCIMAHELSHVVLHSLWHKEKNNEIYTDLTAMILGFSDIMKKGRKNFSARQKAAVTETSVSTYGYLSDTQFDFAYQKINKTLTKYIAMEDSFRSALAESRQQLDACKEESSRLLKLLQYVDRRQNTKMKHEDALVIIKMHEPGYVENISAVISKNEEQLNEVGAFSGNIQSFNAKTLEALGDRSTRIGAASTELIDIFNTIKLNIRVLEKYQGLFLKIKNSLQKDNPCL